MSKPLTVRRNTKKVGQTHHACSDARELMYLHSGGFIGKYLLERAKLVKDNAWKLDE